MSGINSKNLKEKYKH